VRVSEASVRRTGENPSLGKGANACVYFTAGSRSSLWKEWKLVRLLEKGVKAKSGTRAGLPYKKLNLPAATQGERTGLKKNSTLTRHPFPDMVLSPSLEMKVRGDRFVQGAGERMLCRGRFRSWGFTLAYRIPLATSFCQREEPYRRCEFTPA